jgi:hypothetical protein
MPTFERYAGCFLFISIYKFGIQFGNKKRGRKGSFYHEKITTPAGHKWITAIRSATVLRWFLIAMVFARASVLH